MASKSTSNVVYASGGFRLLPCTHKKRSHKPQTATIKHKMQNIWQGRSIFNSTAKAFSKTETMTSTHTRQSATRVSHRLLRRSGAQPQSVSRPSSYSFWQQWAETATKSKSDLLDESIDWKIEVHMQLRKPRRDEEQWRAWAASSTGRRTTALLKDRCTTQK